MNTTGLMHVYYGYGKGKTTAALGLALRASGQGLAVAIVQFLKARPSGELKQLESLENVTVFRGSGSTKFVNMMSDDEKAATKAIHDENLRSALELVQQGKVQLLILDEAMDAYQLALLDESLLRTAIFERPVEVELVITGHQESDWILEAADYVTEMVKRKHPYDQGIGGRKGIEF